MVWTQYVYEASNGNDVDIDSDGDIIEDEPVQGVEDWEIEYSDELWMMWNTIQSRLYDAHLEHSGAFVDFVEFCYVEHEPEDERVTWEYDEDIAYYEPHVVDIWRNIRKIVDGNRMHQDVMRGANIWNFTRYLKNIMCIY
jgi:hypothetical protein